MISPWGGRTVVAHVKRHTDPVSGEHLVTVSYAIAECHIEDRFDKDRGRKLALKKLSSLKASRPTGNRSNLFTLRSTEEVAHKIVFDELMTELRKLSTSKIGRDE